MKLKKVFTRCLAVVFMITSLMWVSPTEATIPHAYAAVEVAVSVEQSNSELMRAEQTEWRFRTVDGKLQKRLWSLTYGYWKTDWEWV